MVVKSFIIFAGVAAVGGAGVLALTRSNEVRGAMTVGEAASALNEHQRSKEREYVVQLRFRYKLSHALRAHTSREFAGVCRCLAVRLCA
jgi:hypothetical protein